VNAISPKQAVSIVLNAIEAKQADSEIARALVAAGSDPSDAPTIVSSIRLGFQSGVQSIVMGTGAHPNADNYYLTAFGRGRSAMRFTSPPWVLLRMIAPFVIGVLILAFLVWRFVL
jgi:hypothetical protein